MASIPNLLDEFRSGDRPPVLIFGAGMSYGLVPLPEKLLAEKWRKVEIELGLQLNDEENPPKDLYVWAGSVLKELEDRNETLPKLKLAEALGLLSDEAWLATMDRQLADTTPRHRVAARFTIEKLWRLVWSLNWDRQFENALERIGLVKGGPANQPWISSYKAIVSHVEFQESRGFVNEFFLFKPHGCVNAMHRAKEALERDDSENATALSERFMITSEELEEARETRLDNLFGIRLVAELHQAPLFVVGWSISEPYLNTLVSTAMEDSIRKQSAGELAIIDVDFNNFGHEKVAELYELPKDDVFFEVDRDADGLNLDSFFLWLQTLYGFDCLIDAFDGQINNVTTALRDRRGRILPTRSFGFDREWVDTFLPIWVLLCWRSNMVECSGYQYNELALERPDLHIPWRIGRGGCRRVDLMAAARLLSMLPQNGGDWDLLFFPGALWNSGSGKLVIPLPAWRDLDQYQALVPFLDRFSDQLGYVQKLFILPLHPSREPRDIDSPRLNQLKDTVSRCIGGRMFFDSDNIKIAFSL